MKIDMVLEFADKKHSAEVDEYEVVMNLLKENPNAEYWRFEEAIIDCAVEQAQDEFWEVEINDVREADGVDSEELEAIIREAREELRIIDTQDADSEESRITLIHPDQGTLELS